MDAGGGGGGHRKVQWKTLPRLEGGEGDSTSRVNLPLKVQEGEDTLL